MPAATRPVRYRFARFELQPDERRLLEGDAGVVIGPRAFDLLAALVERAGQLVTKQELFDRVWPKVFVEETALQMQISALRKILGRDAIATVTGRGYRFKLDVTSVDAAPAVSAAAAKHNLPQALTSFIGRETQISELSGLLTTTRMVTLTGAGGCGKSRLAIEMAANLAGSYPDGVWLVELAALVDPALVPDAVARVFGLKEQPGQALTQTVVEYLASRQLLLVLDNAEHVLESCTRLSDAVLRACARVSILVTSRERLGLTGELIYRVPPLSVPEPEQRVTAAQMSGYESARLFVERAQLQQPRFALTNESAPALASICRRLDGIPLAIELAAARVRSMSLEEVSERLNRRFDLLTGGSRASLPRHRTLRSLIDWSYELLSEAERAVLCRTSVFSGGWSLAAAEQVCGDEVVRGGEMLDVLTSLVDKSLITAKERNGATRYALLESVRHYGRDRLSEGNAADRLSRRHFDHALELAGKAEAGMSGEEQQLWLERLESDHDNLRSALAWSCGPDGSATEGLRLAARLGWFWSARGHAGEGRRWLGTLLDAAPSDSDDQTRANALRWAGSLATDQGDYAAARELLEEAMVAFRRMGDRWGLSRVSNNLGTLSTDQGDHAAARSLFEESMALRRELGDRQGTSIVLSNLGLVAFEMGEHASAQAFFEEGLAIQRTLGDRGTTAILTHNLGAALRNQGAHAPATERLKEALGIWTVLGSRRAVAASFEGFALLALSLAEPARAVRLWARATRLREELGSALPRRAQAGFDRDVASAREALGNDEAFDAAWADGCAMTTEQVTRDLLEL